MYIHTYIQFNDSLLNQFFFFQKKKNEDENEDENENEKEKITL